MDRQVKKDRHTQAHDGTILDVRLVPVGLQGREVLHPLVAHASSIIDLLFLLMAVFER